MCESEIFFDDAFCLLSVSFVGIVCIVCIKMFLKRGGDVLIVIEVWIVYLLLFFRVRYCFVCIKMIFTRYINCCFDCGPCNLLLFFRDKYCFVCIKMIFRDKLIVIEVWVVVLIVKLM